MLNRTKRTRPLVSIVPGLLLLVIGFMYDVMFAGIPYQDATPELAAQYDRHAHIARILYRFGSYVFLAGILVGIGWTIARRLGRAR